MHPYGTFKLYRALKFHFHTEQYDYFKFKGRLKNIKPEEYNDSPDRRWAEKITAKYGKATPNFLLANLSENKLHLHALAVDPIYDKAYLEWSAHRNALTYHFQTDLNKLGPAFDELAGDRHTVPKIFRRYVAGEIQKDTLAIIMNYTNCVERWNVDMKENPYWKLRKNKIVKYLPFVPNKAQFKQILLDKGY